MSKERYYSVRMRASQKGVHLSGAEGLFGEHEVDRIVRSYWRRAIEHERGRCDEVHIAVEELRERPKEIPSLPLCTLDLPPSAMRDGAIEILKAAGVAVSSAAKAFRTIAAGIEMRGAMLIAPSGARVDPDLARGVRVTRLGLTRTAKVALSRKLGRRKLNEPNIREAFVLANKVAAHPKVLAELCVPDNPSHTTGYVATRKHGYVRLPHLKKSGVRHGGRAFFVAGRRLGDLIEYLEGTPILIREIGRCSGLVSLPRVLDG